MKRLTQVAIAFAAVALMAPAAKAAITCDTNGGCNDIFDPLVSSGVTYVLPEPGDETIPEPMLTVTIPYVFASQAVQNYVLFEIGTSGLISDIITVSNNGPAGFGQITFQSDGGDPLIAPLSFIPVDETLGPLVLDIPLLDSGGLDLGVVVVSDGDTSTGGNSDLLSIEVPEPASMAILGLGMAALGVVRRRRR